MTTVIERDYEPFVVPVPMDLEPPFVAIPIDSRPTAFEVLAEVHRITTMAMKAARNFGSIPDMRSGAWMSASIEVKMATIMNLGQAYLLADPERQAMEMVRDISYAFSTSPDWTAESLSYAELTERRTEPGPTPALIPDPIATARWVETGSSEEPTA